MVAIAPSSSPRHRDYTRPGWLQSGPAPTTPASEAGGRLPMEAGWMHRRLARARAPLRLGFGGGGTDVSPYCDQFGGVVLNAAIDLFAHASVGARDDGQVRLEAADRDLSWTGPAARAGESAPDLRLLAGVYGRMCA